MVLRTLLVLSLWHAPIPWVHAHDLIGPDVEHIAELHQHVDRFHAEEVRHGESHLDLHTHLIYPWGRHHSPGAPDDSEPAGSDDGDFLLLAGTSSGVTSSKTFGQPTDRAIDVIAPVDQGPAAHAAVGGHAPLICLSRGAHFLETYGRAVSSRDLFGVRLC